MSSIRITSAQAWIVAPIVAGMLAALPGCTDGQGNDIAQIICLFPDDGAAAMPRTVGSITSFMIRS